MSRPTGFADLVGRRVGIFGYGVEGRATRRRIAELAASIVVVDDAPQPEPDVLVSSSGGHEALLGCEVVLKSPGIARRRADVLDLEAHGVTVTSALNLWLGEVDRSRVVAVTGTKGKSTTTALIAFFLQCLGQDAMALGNFGQPPYDPDIDTRGVWSILEVSSYQCVDIEHAPGVVVVTSLGADHLDWHGSLEQYHDDKLSLTRASDPHRTVVADDPALRALEDRIGGELSFVGPQSHGLADRLGLLGAHSESNVALALRVAALLSGRSESDVRDVVRDGARGFVPLRGRLTLVGEEENDGHRIVYVDDALATAPLPTVAALAVFSREPVALLTGGFDRGVDYQPLIDAIVTREEPTLILTSGDAGERIARLADDARLNHEAFDSMDDAVERARAFLRDGGVVLLSPGAPSFDRYHNWLERSNDFTRSARRFAKWSLGGDSNS